MWEYTVAAFMALMGLGIAGMWTADIVSGSKIDTTAGVLRARDSQGTLLLPHWWPSTRQPAGC